MTYVVSPGLSNTLNQCGLKFVKPGAQGRLEQQSWLNFGLWDNAFRLDGTLRNGPLEADHFCDQDSQRFHIMLRDRSIPRSTNRVEVRWKTLSYQNLDQDTNNNEPRITLERQGSSHDFVSEALLLVSDDVDRQTSVFSRRTQGTSAFGQHENRLRRASMFSDVVAEYAPSGRPRQLAQVPVFQRSPDYRRKLYVELVVVNYLRPWTNEQTPRGAIVDTQRLQRDLQAARDIFERIGIWIQDHPMMPVPALNSRRDHLPNGAVYSMIDLPAELFVEGITNDDFSRYCHRMPALIPHTVRATYARKLRDRTAGTSFSQDPRLARYDPVPGNILISSYLPDDYPRRPGERAHHHMPFTLAHETAHLLMDSIDHFSPAPGVRLDSHLLAEEANTDAAITAQKRIWDSGGNCRASEMRASNLLRWPGTPR